MSSVFKNTGTSSAALPPAGKGARARRNKKAATKQPRAKQADELSAISDQLATIGESLQVFSAKVDEFDKGVTKYSQEKDQMKKDVSAIKTFDPEGAGYDYRTAKKYGITADESGHWPSRVPETGQILKGRLHKTFDKTVEGEKQAGYEIVKGDDGKYYSKELPNPVEAMLAELKSRRADNVAYGNLAAQIDKIKDDYPDETLIRAMRSGMDQISAMTMEDLRQIDAMSK